MYKVVFDSTSAYILPTEEVTSDLEILGTFDDIEDADEYCDFCNSTINK